MKSFQKICCRIVNVLSFISISSLFILSLVTTCTMTADGFEYTVYNKDSVLVNLLFVGIALLLLGLLGTGNIHKCIKGLGYMVVTILYFIAAWYSIRDIAPGYDQGMCVRAAADFLLGDYTQWGYGGYCYVWSNQNGLILFFALLFRVFGLYNIHAIFLLNILLFYLATWIIRYLCGYRIKSKGVLFIIWSAMLLFYPLICYTGFAYGTIPGLFFFVLALLFYLLSNVRGKKFYIILAGGSLFLSICLKSNYLIAAITIIIVSIVRIITEKSLQQVVCCIAFVIGLIAAVKIPGLIMENVTGNSSKAGIPALAWIEMGLQDHAGGTAGWFNSYNYNVYVEGDGEHDVVVELVKEDLKGTILWYAYHPSLAVDFFYRKISAQWNNPDFQANGILANRTNKQDFFHWFVDDDSRFHSVYIWLMDRMMTLVYFGNLCWLWLNRKDTDISNRIGYIFFLGGFIFHIFWEAKCQYTIPYFWLLMPYAIWGMYESVNEFRLTRKRRTLEVSV